MMRAPLLALLLMGCSDPPDSSAPGDRALAWETHQPWAAPEDPLAGTGVESCSRYLDERCEGDGLQRCELYDASTGSWVDSPDTLLERALYYDRWYELYHAPDGQTANREFTTGISPGAPEEEWGDPAVFEEWDGQGDSAIWTSAALDAHMLRYLQTGTEADYQRFEDKLRVVLNFFEVTGIPGYLARYHFLLMDDDQAPYSEQHILEHSGTLDHTDNPIPAQAEAWLPEAYTAGVTDSTGTTWTGSPWWHGNPSIDQYTGPMTTLPAAWGLLRDDDLQERIAEHMTCYLKRLRRVRLYNLQQNEDALEATQALLGGGALGLEEGDIDFAALDEIQGWVLLQYNSRSADSYELGCPESLPTEFFREIDASDSDFLPELVVFFATFASGDLELEEGVDHFYFPSIRGGDAVHMLHLAAMAWHFTGEQAYRDMLDELQRDLRAVEVAHTAAAWDSPKWCNGYYGHHITFTPWWALLNLLEEGPLREELERGMREELWEKLGSQLGNAKFALMYAGAAHAAGADDREQAAAEAWGDAFVESALKEHVGGG